MKNENIPQGNIKASQAPSASSATGITTQSSATKAKVTKPRKPRAKSVSTVSKETKKTVDKTVLETASIPAAPTMPPAPTMPVLAVEPITEVVPAAVATTVETIQAPEALEATTKEEVKKTKSTKKTTKAKKTKTSKAKKKTKTTKSRKAKASEEVSELTSKTVQNAPCNVLSAESVTGFKEASQIEATNAHDATDSATEDTPVSATINTKSGKGKARLGFILLTLAVLAAAVTLFIRDQKEKSLMNTSTTQEITTRTSPILMRVGQEGGLRPETSISSLFPQEPKTTDIVGKVKLLARDSQTKEVKFIVIESLGENSQAFIIQVEDSKASLPSPLKVGNEVQVTLEDIPAEVRTQISEDVDSVTKASKAQNPQVKKLVKLSPKASEVTKDKPTREEKDADKETDKEPVKSSEKEEGHASEATEKSVEKAVPAPKSTSRNRNKDQDNE